MPGWLTQAERWAREDELNALIDLARADGLARYVRNVREARDEGHENVCVYCGRGQDRPDRDPHEWYCPCAPLAPEVP